MSHKSISKIGELESLREILAAETKGEANVVGDSRDPLEHFSDSHQTQYFNINTASRNRRQEEPDTELCLKKCASYTIGKDSFTELVLLSIISYFCVSTEQRFMNMNQEKLRTSQSLSEAGRSVSSSLNQMPRVRNGPGGGMMDVSQPGQS